jgi:hypothetical protein
MLPQKLDYEKMLTTWAQQLNPIIANPILNNGLLQNIVLKTGTNVINHKLGRKLIGWQTTRVRQPVGLHDEQDTNQTPQLTLVLVSDADVTIDLVVF